MSNLHKMEFEQAVLATLMTVDNSYNSLEVKPSVEDFYATRHQEILKAIENLNIQGKPYDVVMVKDLLQANNQLHILGGEQYLMQMMQEAPASFYNIPSYILKLKKLTECRKIEDAGKKIIELAQNTLTEDMPMKAQEIVAGVESVIATDTRYNLQDSSVMAFEVLNEKIQHKKNKTGLAYGVNTGLRDLDAMLGDIEPSHYMVVAGAPGGGKTTMAQMVSLNAVKRNNAPTLFFSGEMAHYEVTNRIVSALGKIQFDHINKGNMTNDDYSSWVHLTVDVFPQYKLDIVDKTGITIQEIRGEIKKSIAKHGRIGCVIVDYIQLMSDPYFKEQYDVITAVSKGLKKIAKDFKVPVIALSQLTKDAIGKKITMSDLRGSGQIAQDADKIVMLYPCPNAQGVIVADVVKNRQGKKGEVRLSDRFEYCQFGNVGSALDGIENGSMMQGEQV